MSTVTKGAVSCHGTAHWYGLFCSYLHQNFVIFTVRDNNLLLKNYSMFRQIIFPIPAI